jgi:hypothetical protein
MSNKISFLWFFIFLEGGIFLLFPQIHRLLKSGKLIHKNKDVEMWKTPYSVIIQTNKCGKLFFYKLRIQNGCELFYNG